MKPEPRPSLLQRIPGATNPCMIWVVNRYRGLVQERTGKLLGVSVAGKPRSSKSPRGRAAGVSRESNTQKKSGRRPLWKTPVGWVGALMTAVVTGVAVALATSFSQHVVSAEQQTTPKGPPVEVENVAAAPLYGDSIAFSRPLDLSRTQLGAFDSTAAGYQLGWDGKNQDYPWAWEHGGAAVNGVTVRVDVQGNRKTAVRIEGMQLSEQCRSPVTGTLFYSPPAGSYPVIHIGFNLDRVHPVAQLLNDESLTFGGPYFLQNTITLAYGEQQQIQLLAITQEHYCEFRVDMSVLEGNSIVHQIIGNGNQPFRVTSSITTPDPVTPRIKDVKFAAYQRLYVGGVASWCGSNWIRANPLTYSDLSPHAGPC